MSSSCSRGQLARWSGSGGAATAGACCGRQLAAMADLTVALWGARRWPGRLYGEGGVGCDGCEWPRVSTGAGRAAARRGGSVRARAKFALWARLEHARQVFDVMKTRDRGFQSTWGLTVWSYRLV